MKPSVLALGSLVLAGLAGCTIEHVRSGPAPAAPPPATVAATPTPTPTATPGPAPTAAPTSGSGGSVTAGGGIATPVGGVAGSATVSWGNWKSPGGEQPNEKCVKESTKELCWDGIDNNCDGQIDEGCPYKGGTLHFMISWKVAVDLDLHIVGPDGKDVSWKMRDGGALVLDQDCHGMKNGVDDCPSGKVENVYFPADRALARGHYRVWVEMFDSRGQKDAVVPFWFGGQVGIKTFLVPFSMANKPGEKKAFEFDVI